jgi:hypothetical protein
MADTTFMHNRYSIKELMQRYLADVKALKPYVNSPIEQTKLQYYCQAINTIAKTNVMDKVQFALTFGRGKSGKVPQIREAFPMLLGNRVGQATQLDLAYARLLLEYASAFHAYQGNLKDWTLRFVMTSRVSPVREFIQREMENVCLLQIRGKMDIPHSH